MLIWSQAAPDEIAFGHIDRLAVLNGASHRQKFKRALEQWRVERGGSEWFTKGIVGLASTFGTKDQDYARHHAWLPNDNALTKLVEFAATKKRYVIQPYKRPLAPKHWKARFFCRECALEDRNKYQFSYWRRLPQFPGIVHCEKHGIGLSFIENGNTPSLPHHHLNRSNQVSGLLTADVAGHPIVTRYYHVARQLLDSEYWIHYFNAYMVLSARCRELGLSDYGDNRRDKLRKKALDGLPRTWVEKCFRNDMHRDSPSNGQCCNFLFDLYGPVAPLKEFALALAVLYDTPDCSLPSFQL